MYVGSIPSSISSLSALVYLDLHINKLTGEHGDCYCYCYCDRDDMMMKLSVVKRLSQHLTMMSCDD